MSEIYRNSINTGVPLSIPEVTPTSALIQRAGDSVVGEITGHTVTVPFSITANDGPFDIEWKFSLNGEEHTITETHEVVTPVFIKADLPEDMSSLSPDQVKRLEVLVRKIIEAHTGQTFGLRKGYTTAHGRGNAELLTTERIASLDSPGYRILNSGFGVYSSARDVSGAVNIKVPAEEELLNASLTGLPRVPRAFRKDTTYKVYGTFGWKNVPEDVKLAAIALAEEFSCDESLWRDRYLRAISAADWRFDYSNLAFAGTGSAKADQLLSKYVINRAVVI